ncbi:MAG: prenyltransferase [Limnochordia bacterium]|jgi:1,4-dihydroxy-2-naphthoate octaprenyltransferase|nr:prenyltransferase [Limnochordia bacterium]
MDLAHDRPAFVRLWWASIRPFSLGTSILPVLFGVSLARQAGYNIRAGVLVLTLLIALLLHIGTNLTNSLYDWTSGHDQPASPQAVPILRDHPHGEKLVRQALSVLALFTALISVLFAYYTTWPMVFWPIVGYLGGIYYTKPPIAYKHKGVSLPAVFLLMGIMLPMVAYAAQTAFVGGELVILCLPLGLLVTAILAANELRDHKEDAAAGSTTFTVRFSAPFSAALYRALVTLPYLCVSISVLWLSLPPAALLVFLALPLTATLIRKVQRHDLRYLDVATARLHGLFCLVYTISMLL